MIASARPSLPALLRITLPRSPPSLQLYRDLRAGQLKGPLNEFQVCIDRGFADRTFAPLAAAAPPPAQDAAVVAC